MKKILFDDKYGLTKAVLEGRKTMTRRIVNFDRVPTLIPGRIAECCLKYAPFKVGEVVAVAQNYEDAGYARDTIQCAKFRTDKYDGWQIGDFKICLLPGWKNKMFVFPTMMPHQIRITNVRVERLQDISDEDCMREGIFRFNLHHHERYAYTVRRKIGDDETIVEFKPFDSPREAFASLIDKLSGKGTWENNPLVYVYEFQLVK